MYSSFYSESKSLILIRRTEVYITTGNFLNGTKNPKYLEVLAFGNFF